MAPNLRLTLLLLAVTAAAAAPPALAGDSRLFLPSTTCSGRVGDCQDPSQETQMGSEAAHRQLWQQNDYISYQALRKNNVPCMQAGQTYYNCRRNAPANPYRRGCSEITRCARHW